MCYVMVRCVLVSVWMVQLHESEELRLAVGGTLGLVEDLVGSGVLRDGPAWTAGFAMIVQLSIAVDCGVISWVLKLFRGRCRW